MRIRQWLAFSLLVLASTTVFAGTQRALLIGVSEYESNLPPLAGSRNDVRLIQELLVEKYGFDRSNIRIMIDEEATRSGILSAIRSLSKTAQPDDIVLIHFSGHGSQAPDTNGDEPDGLDETILPYDSRTPGIADITDDDLNALIGAFRSDSVIVILDSCHSGTGTRSGPTQVTQRWVAPDTRRELYENVATRQVVTLPISENHVFFAAAQESESELDGPFGPDNLRLGLFTAAMVGALVNAPPSITPRQAIEGVNARVEALKASAAGMPIPEPNMEAPLEKQQLPMFVFGTAPPPQPTLDASQTQVQYTAAAQPSFGRSKTVFASVNGRPRPDLARSITASIGAGLSVAQGLQDADAVVDQVDHGVFDIYGPAGVVRVASGLSHSGEGAAHPQVNDYRFLESVLLNAPTIADLLTLENPQQGLAISMRAAGVPDVRSRSGSTRAVKVTVNTANHRLQYYEEGAPRTRANSLQVEVTTSRDCFLTLVSVDALGGVYLLLPNAGQELSGFLRHGRLTAGSTVMIPDSLAADNRAGFYYDYAPPGGVDRVIAVCFADLADAVRFRAQVAKLELGGALQAELFALGSRGLTDITPGQPRPAQVAATQPPRPAANVTGQAPAMQPSQEARWAAAKLSLTVGK